MVSMTNGISKSVKQAYIRAYSDSSGTSNNSGSYTTNTDYCDWSTAHLNNNPGEFIRLPPGERLEIIEPKQPTKFWECEYCGTVNPIDLLDCRGKACGHSITKKAMQAAFEHHEAPPVLDPKTDSGPFITESFIDHQAEIRWPGVIKKYDAYRSLGVNTETKSCFLLAHPDLCQYIAWKKVYLKTGMIEGQ
jgi:hypothetical protein